MVISINWTTCLSLTSGSLAKRSWAQRTMSMLTLVTGRKLPRSTRIGAFAQQLRRLQHFTARPEDRGAAKTHLHQLETHHAVIDVAELNAGKFDHVDFNVRGGQVVEERLEDQVRSCDAERKQRKED